MKRSEVNKILLQADDFIRSFNFVLPPFAYWTPDEFKRRRGEAKNIIDARLGWDITDFGGERFAEFGIFLFTLRNGRAADLAKGRGMLYAEKLLICQKGQMNPNHRHNIKTEDIINRGGGRFTLELFMSGKDGKMDTKAEVVVPTDGIVRRLPAGGHLTLGPGESITLYPGVWHRFWVEDEKVLIGEVSSVNDDLTDNVFADPIGRFAKIEEDEPPVHLLVADYDKFLG